MVVGGRSSRLYWESTWLPMAFGPQVSGRRNRLGYRILRKSSSRWRKPR